MYKKTIHDFITFLKDCPTAFHTVKRISEILEEQGYKRLWESSRWEVQPEGKYYIIRNDSSLIAFHTGPVPGRWNFQIAASHSDSPTFKIKECPELEVRGKYIQLNTEGYGGMLCSTWFDRPLSVAGRLIVKEGEHFVSRIVKVDRDLLLIPSVAIHMNRNANEGFAYNKQIDLLPLFGGQTAEKGAFLKQIAEAAGVAAEEIRGSDLYLYSRQEPALWGAEEEFISAQRLDDLQCVYGTLQGFLQGRPNDSVHVFACFDSEEVGSRTRQGADSAFLSDILRRFHGCLGGTQESFFQALSESFLVSADNAHAVHPNHPEKSDPKNCVYMNEGIVIKSHAGQKYISDGVSIALFSELCKKAGAPVQFFANRSDMAGGSTLGNLAISKIPLYGVDIGLPQLAMHSACETAGAKDTDDLIRVMKEFYSTRFRETKGRISLC